MSSNRSDICTWCNGVGKRRKVVSPPCGCRGREYITVIKCEYCSGSGRFDREKSYEYERRTDEIRNNDAGA